MLHSSESHQGVASSLLEELIFLLTLKKNRWKPEIKSGWLTKIGSIRLKSLDIKLYLLVQNSWIHSLSLCYFTLNIIIITNLATIISTRMGMSCDKSDSTEKRYKDVQKTCCECCMRGKTAGRKRQSCNIFSNDKQYCRFSFKSCCEDGKNSNTLFVS